jgi:hypothetical protein
MKTIHKFHVGLGMSSLMLPPDAKVLTVQMQRDTPQMWILLDTDAACIVRRFVTVGTGHDMSAFISEKAAYVGTFQMNEGALVLHVFEIFS